MNRLDLVRDHRFKRDMPEAEIHLLDAGHFALDEKNDANLAIAFGGKAGTWPDSAGNDAFDP